VDVADLPSALRRRIVGDLIGEAESPVDGPTLSRALDQLDKGRATTVGRYKLSPGRRILIEIAPVRR
jgi:hypothetical protein